MTPEEIVKSSWYYKHCVFDFDKFVGDAKNEFGDYTSHRFMWIDFMNCLTVIDFNLDKSSKLIPFKREDGGKEDFKIQYISVDDMRQMLALVDAKEKADAKKAATA